MDKPTQQYINSAKMISSTWALQLFTNPMDSTHKEHFRNMVGNRMMQ